MAGRLGQAVVLAYRNEEGTARASNQMVMNVLNDPHPKASAVKKESMMRTPFQVVSNHLMKHPDLWQAVSDALNRNMMMLKLNKLEPPPLELLRAPPRMGVK